MNYVCSAAHMCAHVCMRVFPDCWEETVLSPYLDPSRDVDTTPGSEDRILCMHHAPWGKKATVDVQKEASPGLRTVFTFVVSYFCTFASATASWALGMIQFHMCTVCMHFSSIISTFLQKTLEESSPQQSVFGPFPAFH